MAVNTNIWARPRTPASVPNTQDTAASPENLAAIRRVAPLHDHLWQVLYGPPHRSHRIDKWTMPDAGELANWGFYRSIGRDAARSHWRLELPDGREIHVLEQEDHYAVHWDHVSLRHNPIQHLVEDAPGVALLALVALALFTKYGGLR